MLSSIDYTLALGGNVEGLTLTGNAISAIGNELDNQITGNDQDNIIDGGAGNDLLYGGNGTLNTSDGSDILIGGTGDDTYLVDDASEVIVEAVEGGIDMVISSAAIYTLADNIENLTFLDGDAIFYGTGNSLNNIITASSTNNVLDGLAGDDMLIGQTGYDTLTGGTRPTASGAYQDATGRFVFDFNTVDQSLTISLDGQVSMVVQNYSLSTNTLGITLNELPVLASPQIVVVNNVVVNQVAAELVSTDSIGVQANDYSGDAIISANGRYVVFQSYADNLVSTDTNAFYDLFVKDLQTGEVNIVSTDSAGLQVAGTFTPNSISSDGRYVLFSSYADNLIPGDANSSYDVFLKDMLTGAISRVNVDNSGEIIAQAFAGDMSADGRYITFTSHVNNLATNDTNSRQDIFVKDMQTGNISNITLNLTAFPSGAFYSLNNSSISNDGNIITFSTNQNLSLGQDVFSYNKSSGTFTPLASTNQYYSPGYTSGALVSGNGNFVLYGSGGQLYVKNR